MTYNVFGGTLNLAQSQSVSTLRDGAFFHNLARVLHKSDHIFMKFPRWCIFRQECAIKFWKSLGSRAMIQVRTSDPKQICLLEVCTL